MLKEYAQHATFECPSIQKEMKGSSVKFDPGDQAFPSYPKWDHFGTNGLMPVAAC